MISLNWLKDYIDISDQDPNELAVKITKAGVNIEKVITHNIPNLVVGEVKTCVIHPNSDHLHITTVDIGDKVLQIVCGAPNVRAGLKVIVALPGCELPGDFKIKPSTIRGVESNGMLCALYELGLEAKTDETYSKGICELPSNAPIGTNPLKVLGLDDTLYELDIHKHRNNDCYSHIPFAYEMGTILDRKICLPETTYNVISENINDNMKLKVETDKCSYYLGKMIKDIKIGPSPEFIKKRLESVGMHSINNVVDISNYVMLEYGQPMHFYDADKLGNNIIVRDALPNEKIITLDNNERILCSKDIVISDNNMPKCIAGVMGGESSEITENTSKVFIESAIFDAVSIRNTASRLNLKSEASIRFGKGLNYEYTKEAMNRACYLLEKYANAKIFDGMLIHDTIDKTLKIVEFTSKDINKMLGIIISDTEIASELNRLDFKYELNNNIFKVTIPARRIDIDPNINDIAEEIGRLYGYQNLVSTLPKLNVKKGEYVGDVKYRKLISKRLRALGLTEAKTYTLVSPDMAKLFNYENKKNVVLPNPMSYDKSVVRTTLIPSLLNTYEYNKARKVDDILIYEIAKTYDADYKEDTKIAILMKGNYIVNLWQHNIIKVDFYVIKGIVENLLNYLGFKNRYNFVKNNINDIHPGMGGVITLDNEEIGIIGRIHPSLKKDDIYVAEISLNRLMKTIKPLKYIEANHYPEIKKDAAYIVSKEITAEEIFKQIKKSGGRLLTNIELFDLYEGENLNNDSKSLAFSLTFSDVTRTLSDEEAMASFNKINQEVCAKFNAQLRDK
jgi:phenylalanyl-tRNA synthetase beta chain